MVKWHLTPHWPGAGTVHPAAWILCCEVSDKLTFYARHFTDVGMKPRVEYDILNERDDDDETPGGELSIVTPEDIARNAAENEVTVEEFMEDTHLITMEDALKYFPMLESTLVAMQAKWEEILRCVELMPTVSRRPT
jgi:hypothetical protein